MLGEQIYVKMCDLKILLKKIRNNFAVSNIFTTFAPEMSEGTRLWFPRFYKIINMLIKQDIQTLIEEKLQGTGYELITFTISAQNELFIEIDCLEGVDVEFCAELNRYLVEQLDAQGELDYSLEVGSVSLTDPFKTKMQYEKHLSHPVEVLTADGKKMHGQLVDVNDDSFAIDAEIMVAVEGKKRKQKQIQTITFAYSDVKYTRYELKV